MTIEEILHARSGFCCLPCVASDYFTACAASPCSNVEGPPLVTVAKFVTKSA